MAQIAPAGACDHKTESRTAASSVHVYISPLIFPVIGQVAGSPASYGGSDKAG